MMNPKELIVIRYFGEFFNAGRWEFASELLAENIVFHGGVQITGLPPYVGFVQSLRRSFPDLRLEVEDFFGEGEKFAARFTLRGTQSGEFVGIPPTGKQVQIAGIDLFRLDQGKIAEIWGIVNALGMFQQLGSMPSGN